MWIGRNLIYLIFNKPSTNRILKFIHTTTSLIFCFLSVYKDNPLQAFNCNRRVFTQIGQAQSLIDTRSLTASLAWGQHLFRFAIYVWRVTTHLKLNYLKSNCHNSQPRIKDRTRSTGKLVNKVIPIGVDLLVNCAVKCYIESFFVWIVNCVNYIHRFYTFVNLINTATKQWVNESLY